MLMIRSSAQNVIEPEGLNIRDGFVENDAPPLPPRTAIIFTPLSPPSKLPGKNYCERIT